MRTSKLVSSLVMAVIFTVASTSMADTGAQTGRFVTLFLLKTTVGQINESTQDLQEKVQRYSKYYKSLRFFQLNEKRKVGRQNCAEIQATNMANAVMLTALLESVEQDLKNIPELNQELALSKLSKIVDYLRASKAASETCSVPPTSLQYVKRANTLIGEAHAYLESVKNELSK